MVYSSISEGRSVEKLGKTELVNHSFFEVCNVDVSQKQLSHLCRWSFWNVVPLCETSLGATGTCSWLGGFIIIIIIIIIPAGCPLNQCWKSSKRIFSEWGWMPTAYDLRPVGPGWALLRTSAALLAPCSFNPLGVTIPGSLRPAHSPMQAWRRIHSA